MHPPSQLTLNPWSRSQAVPLQAMNALVGASRTAIATKTNEVRIVEFTVVCW